MVNPLIAPRRDNPEEEINSNERLWAQVTKNRVRLARIEERLWANFVGLGFIGSLVIAILVRTWL